MSFEHYFPPEMLFDRLQVGKLGSLLVFENWEAVPLLDVYLAATVLTESCLEKQGLKAFLNQRFRAELKHLFCEMREHIFQDFIFF